MALKNNTGKLALGAFLASAILLLIAFYVGTPDILANLKGMSPEHLVLAIILYTVSWPIRGERYQQILSRLGKSQKLGFLTGSIFVSQSANVVLPARLGDITRAYILKKGGDVPVATGFSSLFLERIFDIVAITLIAGVAALSVSREIAIDPWILNTVWVSFALVLLLCVILYVIYFMTRVKKKPFLGKACSSKKLDSRILKFKNLGFQFLSEIGVVAEKPKTFVLVLLSSVLVWTIDIITCFEVLTAFHAVNFSKTYVVFLIFLAVAIGNICKMFPLTPGSIGTYEASLVAVFNLGGIDPSIGFTVAVLDHFIKNLITLVGGGIALSSFGMKWKELLSLDSGTFDASESKAE